MNKFILMGFTSLIVSGCSSSIPTSKIPNIPTPLDSEWVQAGDAGDVVLSTAPSSKTLEGDLGHMYYRMDRKDARDRTEEDFAFIIGLASVDCTKNDFRSTKVTLYNNKYTPIAKEPPEYIEEVSPGSARAVVRREICQK